MPTAPVSNLTWCPIPFALLATAIAAIFVSSLAHGQPLPVVLALAERLSDDDASVRQATVAALRAMGKMAKPAIPAIARRLRDPDAYIRIVAAHVLERLGPDSVPSLTELLQDADPHVRELAARTLQKIATDTVLESPAVAR